MENVKIKEPVKLKQRVLKDATISLYLEISTNGIRRYETLRLYLVKERTKADRQSNIRNMELAEAVRAKRVVELRNSKYGFTNYEDGKGDLLEYMVHHAARVTKHGVTTSKRARVVAELLRKYAGCDTLSFNRANNKNFIEGFISFLYKYKSFGGGCIREKYKRAKPLSEGTVHEYFKVFECILIKAVKEGIIPNNEAERINKNMKPKRIRPERNYLTKEELQKLIDTSYGRTRNPARNMFLFGCATGLRFSDIVSLKWSNIFISNGRTWVDKKQIKTDHTVTFPLSAMALRLLPKRREGDNGFVFKHTPTNNDTNTFLRRWAARAGIKKDFTFHASRHTFATLILSEGADLYTVSKLLGHKDIESTQIYAKVVDESKNKAVDLLPDFLDDHKK